jgi:hypothetical protein
MKTEKKLLVVILLGIIAILMLQGLMLSSPKIQKAQQTIPIDTVAVIKGYIATPDKDIAYDMAIAQIDREITAADDNFVRAIYYLTGIKPPIEGGALRGWLSFDSQKRIAYWKKVFPMRSK